MSKPLIVSIPHNLGQEGAVQRIKDGVVYLRTQHANKISVLQDDWTANSLAFKAGTMGQSVSGTIDCEADKVTLTVQLPWMLAMLADKARALIEKEGKTLLIEKK